MLLDGDAEGGLLREGLNCPRDRFARSPGAGPLPASAWTSATAAWTRATAIRSRAAPVRRCGRAVFFQAHRRFGAVHFDSILFSISRTLELSRGDFDRAVFKTTEISAGLFSAARFHGAILPAGSMQ